MDSKEIKYRSVLSIIESGICKKIDSWNLKEGNLILNPSSTSESSNVIKVSWRNKEYEDYENLREFYSPIVYRVKYEIKG